MCVSFRMYLTWFLLLDCVLLLGLLHCSRLAYLCFWDPPLFQTGLLHSRTSEGTSGGSPIEAASMLLPRCAPVHAFKLLVLLLWHLLWISRGYWPHPAPLLGCWPRPTVSCWPLHLCWPAASRSYNKRSYLTDNKVNSGAATALKTSSCSTSASNTQEARIH